MFKVFVKKNGKWKRNSEHTNFDFAEVNAKVQFEMGFETKVEEDGATVLHLKKKEK